MKSQEIRSKFLDFFKEKSHEIVASSPMILKDDPTLMFVNSGMAPFKEFFLGNGVPKSNRIADTQKCLRVSGKHNDLEEVGYDTYHHTMFEMLGNWSFGDYFKEEAIQWAWELLTNVYGISQDILYVTIFVGSSDADNLQMDKEAYRIWKKYVPGSRILMGNKKDNFWEMGNQGPCGPCSEIHVDIRPKEERLKVDGKSLINTNHPQVVEIWNLVFMQYNRKANGALEDLPAKHIDTGMGFERLCMILQGVTSNYDTDIFTPFIKEIEAITNSTYGKNEKTDIAIRVIADHVRAVAFSIADGQLPSNTGAGYVIRRILRRAIRYGFTFLEKKEPFIYRLVDVISKKMGKAFPELKAQEQFIKKIIQEEEKTFLKTISLGLLMLQSKIDSIKSAGKATDESLKKIISGKNAFKLYDTYGIPLDLTELIAKENDFLVDVDGFNEEMKKQKERSRSASESSADDWILVNDSEEKFVGYDALETKVILTRYRKVSSKKDGDIYQLVFDKTPFYPEGGGQIGDKGHLEDSQGNIIDIIDTKKENNIIIHFTKSLPEYLGDFFNAVVDNKQRQKTTANHTATHLLHQALREVLGTHVQQKGSAIHSEYLRFDFSHFSKMTVAQLHDVENFVNAKIEEKLPLIEKRNIPKKQAIAEGAMSLFGEKYGDTVRSIRFGESIELCGGTHVQNTGDVWYFKIKSESAVASGIRRIEAITFDAVKKFYSETDSLLLRMKHLSNNLKQQKQPLEVLQSIQNENTSFKKQVEQLLVEQLLKDEIKNLKSELKSESAVSSGIRRIEAITFDAVKKFYSETDSLLLRMKHLLNNPKQSLEVLQSIQNENTSFKKQVEQLLKDEIKNLKYELKSESAVSSGIRRIEAITFDAVKKSYSKTDSLLLRMKHLSNNLKQQKQPLEVLQSIQNENTSLKKQVEQLLKDEIKNLKSELKSESAVSSGIRRIEAITFDAVKKFYSETDSLLLRMKHLLNNPKQSLEVLQSIQNENTSFKKQVEQLLKDEIKNLKYELKSESAVSSGIRRIEAIRFDAVKKSYSKTDSLLLRMKHLSNNLKQQKQPLEVLQSIQNENTSLKKQVEQLLKDEIKNLKSELKSESAVSSGIRRIEAITFDAVKKFYSETDSLLLRMKHLLNNPKQSLEVLQSIQNENTSFKKQVEQLLKDEIKNLKYELKSESAVSSGIRRIEAITFDAVKKSYSKTDSLLLRMKHLSNNLKQQKQPLEVLQSIQNENTSFKKQVEQLLKDEIKNLKSELKSESAVSSGIRRIEAITFDAVKKSYSKTDSLLLRMKHLLNNPKQQKQPLEVLQSIQNENTSLKKQVEQLLKDEIKNLKYELKSESAVSSGIRRIEAITFDAVKKSYSKTDSLLLRMKHLSNNLKQQKQPLEVLQSIQNENTSLKKQVEQLLKDKIKNLKSELKKEIIQINNIQFLGKEIDLDQKSMKNLAFELGNEFKNLFLLLGANINGRAILICYISKEIVSDELNANTIVRKLGEKYIDGKGGGQAFFATAGGTNPDGIKEALKGAESFLESYRLKKEQ